MSPLSISVVKLEGFSHYLIFATAIIGLSLAKSQGNAVMAEVRTDLA